MNFGIRLVPCELGVRDFRDLVEHGYPVAFQVGAKQANDWVVFQKSSGRWLEGVRISGRETTAIQVQKIRVSSFLHGIGLKGEVSTIVAIPLVLSDEAAQSPRQVRRAALGAAPHHPTLTPWRRLVGLIRSDWRDIASVLSYAAVIGILSLATPLAVEWVVTTIAFGRYLQPLIILAMILFVLLLFSGALRVLQAWLIEIMQQRLFVRVAADLSFRLPRVERSGLHGTSGSELVNRFLDIATVQKAVAMLLLDGSSIVLSTIIGMTVLAVYHPFLLGFDAILLGSMLFTTFIMSRGGVRTSIEESIVKYKVLHWLQEVVSKPEAFRLAGGAEYSIDRTNALSKLYLDRRRRHYRIVIRQMIVAVSLQAFASMALLGIGGWLVLSEQLTLGQLVASELIVTVIVGAFAKITKSLENFYDLMAAVDKVGHILDLSMLPNSRPLKDPTGAMSVRWQNLVVHDEHSDEHIYLGSQTVPAGARVAILSLDSDAPSRLVKYFAGLETPISGFAEIHGIDSRDVVRAAFGKWVASVSEIELFDGSVLDNITLHRSDILLEDVRWALELVGLKESVFERWHGLDEHVSSDGLSFTRDERVRLVLARAIAGKPAVLMIDHLLDLLPQQIAIEVLSNLAEPSNPWTLLLVSSNEQLIRNLERIKLD